MGIDEVSEKIGSLDGRVEALDRRIENFNSTWQRQDSEAKDGRLRLHTKFEEMQAKVLSELSAVAVKLSQVNGRMDSIDRDLATLKPRAEVAHDDRQQLIGSKKTLALVWAGLIGLLTALTTGLVELLHYWMNLPPSHPH